MDHNHVPDISKIEAKIKVNEVKEKARSTCESTFFLIIDNFVKVYLWKPIKNRKKKIKNHDTINCRTLSTVVYYQLSRYQLTTIY